MAGHLQIAERGRDRTYLTGLIRARDGLSEARVTDAQLKIGLIPGTRRFSQVDAAVVLDDGRSFSLRAEPLGSSIAMPGLGYGGWNDGEGLGKHRGEFHAEWDTWNVAHPEDVVTAAGETERPRHRIAPVRVTALGGERDPDVGTGSLTFIARGDLPQYDLV